MPIYAYKCESCGHSKDVLQKFSDALLTACPACGAATFKKQVTAAGFQLKGSGWYVTDFRGGASGAAPASSGDGADNSPAPAASPSASAASPAPSATAVAPAPSAPAAASTAAPAAKDAT